jgi:hypothetical protein
MKIILFVFFIALTQLLYGQDTIFYDNDWKVAKKTNASFYRIVLASQGAFVVKDYYINNVLQMTGQSSLRDSLVMQGEFNYYNEKGSLVETTNFLNNVKQGKSISYFDNGQLKRVTHFVNGDFNGETIYYTSNGVMIGKGEAKDNYWYGKWESYKGDGSFSHYLYYDEKYIFNDIRVNVSTPSHIWIYFDKKEEDSLITYLCRPVNDKINALNKYTDAPDVNIFIPKHKTGLNQPSSQFDYMFSIKDTSLQIGRVKMREHVSLNNSFYTYFFIDVLSKYKNFTIAITAKESKFPIYESVVKEFINNLTLVTQ